MLHSNNHRSSLAAKTHDRPSSGFIGDLDAKSVWKSQRLDDERLAITRKAHDPIASAQDKQKQYADQIGRKNMNALGDKYYLVFTLPKHTLSGIPGGTTKLLPRFIEPFTVLEEVGD